MSENVCGTMHVLLVVCTRMVLIHLKSHQISLLLNGNQISHRMNKIHYQHRVLIDSYQRLLIAQSLLIIMYKRLPQLHVYTPNAVAKYHKAMKKILASEFGLNST